MEKSEILSGFQAKHGFRMAFKLGQCYCTSRTGPYQSQNQRTTKPRHSWLNTIRVNMANFSIKYQDQNLNLDLNGEGTQWELMLLVILVCIFVKIWQKFQVWLGM